MQPLSGRRVVEFCNIAAGPYCGCLLADFGADVIKVEKPGGDDMRSWPPVNDGDSENFASINRNKRSIVLDLKAPADRAIAMKLAARADVLLENNRPGVMGRLGLGYGDVAKLNRRIVYASISAFGQQGPSAETGGFDLTIQGLSGIMSVTGEDGAAPVKCGVPISDMATGLYAAFAISSALLEVERTGQGAHIDISMLGASLGVSALQTSEYFGSGRNAPPMGSRHPRNAPYQAFRARDGYFVMAAGNNALFRAVCNVVGKPDLAEWPDFATPTLRAANQADLAALLEEIFASQPARHWIAAFTAAGVPCGPINSFEDALTHPQVAHYGFVQALTLPSGRTTRTFGSPVVFDGMSNVVVRRPPALDEHRDEIIGEIHGSSSPGVPSGQSDQGDGDG
ncbi:MAG: CaiB/BaiF CoA transferase family protein [Hyphomicrobiaceae bacterium]